MPDRDLHTSSAEDIETPEFNRRTNESLWSATTAFPRPASERKTPKAEVCVVGDVIAGLTTAYLLALEGKSDPHRQRLLRWAWRNHPRPAPMNVINAPASKEIFVFMEKRRPTGGRGHTAAISKIEFIAAKEGIECDFSRVDGYLFLGPDDKDNILDEELLPGSPCRWRNGRKDRRLPLMHAPGAYLRFAGQAQFHPGKYIAGLAQAFKRAGGKFYGSTEAKEIKGGDQATVRTTNEKKITADTVVVATNTPMNDWVTMHTKQAAYRTYVIGVQVPLDSIPAALYWDTEDPFHYVRVQRVDDGENMRDILLIGGEDHKTGQTEDLENRYARLLKLGAHACPDCPNQNFVGPVRSWIRWTVWPTSAAIRVTNRTCSSPPVHPGSGSRAVQSPAYSSLT